MEEPQRRSVSVDGREIAILERAGAAPGLFWLGGFKSDMAGTKARVLDEIAVETGHAYTRFDYSGHGASSGNFEESTISAWLDEALAVFKICAGPRVLVGSSMGGWISLLLARRLGESAAAERLAGIVLIAPAIDMTERLMWQAFPEEIRREVTENGVWSRPSAYEDGPYPITRSLIEDGRSHLMLDDGLPTLSCPLHILHGAQDPDVPLQVSLDLVAALENAEVTLTVVRDGDHRLSRDQDIALLARAVRAMLERG